MLNTVLLDIAGTIGAIILLIGLATAYGGFAIYILYVQLIGFIFGLGAGGAVGLAFTAGSSGSIGDQLLLVGAAAFVGGLIGSAVAVALQKLMVTVLGFVATILFTAGLTGLDLMNPLVLVLGVGGGLFAWVAYVGTIIVATAVLGAMTVSAVATFETGFSGISSVFFTGLFWFIFLSGAAIQGGLFTTFGLPGSDEEMAWNTDDTTGFREQDSSTTSSDPPGSDEYNADGGATTTEFMHVGDVSLCSACSSPTHNGYSYCYHCGAEFDTDTNFDEPVAADMRKDSYAAMERFCTACGGPAYDEYSYCYNCGRELTTETITSEAVYPRPASLPPLVPPSSLSTTDITACSRCSARNDGGRTQCYYCDQALTT